jgi:hypothetical protein
MSVLKYLLKKEEPALINAWTGYRPTKFGNVSMFGAGVGIGAVTYGTSQYLNDRGLTETSRKLQLGQVVYSGNAPSLAYDGSPNINTVTGKYDLGATGDMVFAMSANRRG